MWANREKITLCGKIKVDCNIFKKKQERLVCPLLQELQEQEDGYRLHGTNFTKLEDLHKIWYIFPR